jgi:GT2 family glycosyltransferase
MALFSIIIPLYNKEKYIENAINSILKQTITDYEIIIVDDGSTDSGKEIISKYVSDKISIIDHHKNRGLSAARNTGIKNATSDYIPLFRLTRKRIFSQPTLMKFIPKPNINRTMVRKTYLPILMG